MKYYLLFFLAVLFTKTVVYAQAEGDADIYEEETSYQVPINPAEVSRKTGYNAEPIDVRRFDRKKWESIVGDEDYTENASRKKRKQQDLDSARSQSNSSKRLKRALEDDAEGSEDSSTTLSPMTSLILKYVVYGLAIGIIAYVIFLIVKNSSLRSKGKLSKTDLPDHSAPIEDIKELEIDRLLREARESGNYRLVVRIYFLGLLQKLDEDGFITWKKDKTNRDYLSELFSKAHYYDEIRNLTLAYEQVWYGDHNLPMPVYEQIISSFKGIDQKLNASKPQ